MWIIIKYKSNELNLFKSNLKDKLQQEIEFYLPKVKIEKYIYNKLIKFEKNILENYLICKNNKFLEKKNLERIKNVKGLQYILSASAYNQLQIEKFVNFCKSHEDDKGYLKQDFFDLEKHTRAKFVSGPFSQMIFEIMDQRSKRLKLLLNNFRVTIKNKSSNFLYSYI